jgi:hypothetical protein
MTLHAHLRLLFVVQCLLKRAGHHLCTFSFYIYHGITFFLLTVNAWGCYDNLWQQSRNLRKTGPAKLQSFPGWFRTKVRVPI